jgi:hypothetical protein
MRQMREKDCAAWLEGGYPRGNAFLWGHKAGNKGAGKKSQRATAEGEAAAAPKATVVLGEAIETVKTSRATLGEAGLNPQEAPWAPTEAQHIAHPSHAVHDEPPSLVL